MNYCVMHSAMTNIELLAQLSWGDFAASLDEVPEGPGFIAEVTVKNIHIRSLAGKVDKNKITTYRTHLGVCPIGCYAVPRKILTRSTAFR